MRQHREWQTDLSTKLKLKQAAIAALPPELREAALIPDDTLFPVNRQIWTETPPIEEVADDAGQGAAADGGGPGDKQQKRRGGRRPLGTKVRS